MRSRSAAEAEWCHSAVGHRHEHRVVVEPALVAVPERHVQGRRVHVLAELRDPLGPEAGVGLGERHDLAVGDDLVQGGADQVEEGVVAGGGGARQGGDHRGVPDAVPAVRPRPAVVPAVPAALQQPADGAVRRDVVRHDPAVGGRALPPRADVLGDPVAVALLAGQDQRVEDQPGRGEVDRGVAGAHPAAHLLAQPRVAFAFGLGGAGRQHPVQREAVHLGLLRQPRVGRAVEQALPPRVAAVVRTADDAVPGVVVAVRRVDVEIGEAQRPLGPALGGGHAQEVQQQQALALVEPVVAALVLVVQHAELGELPGDALPVALGRGEQIVGAAEQVELRPVEERLVEVVHAVTRGQPVVVQQPPVRSGEVAREPAPGVVEQVEQLPLRDRPARRLEQRYRGRDDGVHPGRSPFQGRSRARCAPRRTSCGRAAVTPWSRRRAFR